VTAHDPRLDDRMRLLCLHGISRDAWNRYTSEGNWHYDVTASGFKYNLSDIQAAIGLHQLAKQERFVELRSSLARQYNEAFADIPELELPPTGHCCRHAWHLYALRLRLETLDITRAEFIEALRQRQIGASVHFIPIPLLSFFAPYAALPQNYCPMALALYPRLVSLPLYPVMTAQQIAYVVDAVKDIVLAGRKTRQVAVHAVAADLVTGSGT
jgi:dTDP-4-amino-4,6-dideoxygalactose transaminase